MEIPSDIDFLREETKTISTITIPSPLESDSQFRFVAIAADMDRINLIHIYEGDIKIGKLNPETPEEHFSKLEEVFGAKAWEIASNQLPSKFLKGKLEIHGTKSGTHSEVSDGLEVTTARILAYPTNQKRLIVQTLDEGWHIGLLIQIMDTIQKSIKL